MTTTSETPSVDEAEAALERAHAAAETRRREEATAAMRRANAANAKKTACVVCERPGQRLRYVGTTERERLEGIKEGIGPFHMCWLDWKRADDKWSQRRGAEMVGDRHHDELVEAWLDQVDPR